MNSLISFDGTEKAVCSEIALVINAFHAVIDEHSAVYVSSPITSGRRFLTSMEGQSREELINRNLTHSMEVILRLRERCKGLILINPGVLRDVEGWEQPQYLLFWQEVIKVFASKVVFINDWQYSRGCSFEFLLSVRENLSTLDENLNELNVIDGLRFIRDAIVMIESSGRDPRFHREVAQELEMFC